MKAEMVNQLLEKFYKLFYEIEAAALKQGISELTTTELHVIEAIGTESLSMNELSDKLGITMGTATISINKLLEKKFIERKRCLDDRRKVFVSLSKKGVDALSYHSDFHKTIISNITKNLSDFELTCFVDIFEKVLSNLNEQLEYFKPAPITVFEENSILKIFEIKGSPAIKDFFEEKSIKKDSFVKLLIKDKDNISIEVENNIYKISIIDAKNIIVVKKILPDRKGV